MKMILTSDTHYGHSKNTHKVHEEFLTQLKFEIEAEDVKVLIHAGDWASNSQHQLKRTLLMFRRYIQIPIVAVRGNHDFWNYDTYRPKKRWGELQELHRTFFKDANIHYLGDGPLVIDNHIIVGFDGWYNDLNAQTNDAQMMVSHIETGTAMQFHNRRAYQELDAILQMDLSAYEKAVCVTHFPPFTENPAYLQYCANPSFFPFLKEKFDALCVGHSHHYWNEDQEGCLILNSGSDYDKPEFLLFDTEWDKEKV